MTVTLELSSIALKWLQAEAEAQGTDVLAIVEARLAYARARAEVKPSTRTTTDHLAYTRARVEAHAILSGPFHPIEEAGKRLRDTYGLADLSALSIEELAERISSGLAKIDPEKLAEAERAGLL